MAERDSKCYGVIYVLTNMVNGKKYVGQTTMDVMFRFSKHCLTSQARTRVSYAIEKYGKENFKVETVACVQNQSDLNYLERLFIAELQTTNTRLGYNVTPGGQGGIRTKEAAEKAAQKLRGRKIPRESVEKMAATKRNRPRTPAEQAVLDKMIELATGRKHTEESRRKMSEVAIGKKMPPTTEGHRKKLSDAAKRQWESGRGHSQNRRT
jgi:group I intron endonuclease